MKRLCLLIAIALLLIIALSCASPNPTLPVRDRDRVTFYNQLDTFSYWSEVEEYVLSTPIPYRTFIEGTYDCENFAIDLTNQAIKDRKPLGLVLVLYMDNDGIEDAHLMNFAIVDNLYVFVEPQTGEVFGEFEGWQVLLD